MLDTTYRIVHYVIIVYIHTHKGGNMRQLSKQLTLQEYASLWVCEDTKKYILENEAQSEVVHYENNSALPCSYICLSYPVYEGDYYFAFIADSVRVNSQYNAKANRQLRYLVFNSSLNRDEVFNEMLDYFAMHFKNAGSGDTCTREELWCAVNDLISQRKVA